MALLGGRILTALCNQHKLQFFKIITPYHVPTVSSSTTWQQEFYNRQSDINEEEPRTQVIESKEEFKYVKRLIPPLEIPPPPKHEHYPTPSGWSAPTGPDEGTTYFIRRSRFHNLPVYIHQKHGGNQIWTVVRNIDGDILTFGEKLLKHLEVLKGAEVGMHINEYTKSAWYKGVFAEETKQWLSERGF